MNDALPLPAALPATTTTPSTPAAPVIPAKAGIQSGANDDVASASNPVELLANVTDADSLFGALMTIANAPPAESKAAIAVKADDAPDADVSVMTDPIAAALLALPVIPATSPSVIPSEARDILKISLDAPHPGMTLSDNVILSEAKDLLKVSLDAPHPGMTQDTTPTVPSSPDKPKLDLSIQILPQLPQAAAEPATAHRAQALDAVDLPDASAVFANLPQLQLPATAATNAPLPQAPEVTVPPSHPQWAEQVAASVVWCVKQKLTEAEVRLHPPELGPVRVTLRLDHDAVDVRIVAANPATRDALEQTLPQLRDLFQQQGLSLVQAQVGDSSAHASRERMPQLQPMAPVASDAADAPVHAATIQLKRAGLLDEYA